MLAVDWNIKASYTGALLKCMKFDLEEGSIMDVKTLFQILLCNPDADKNMKVLNGQTDYHFKEIPQLLRSGWPEEKRKI